MTVDDIRGLVIKVKDWPGTVGLRFEVLEVRDVPGSEHPRQVHALELEPDGRAARFRAFPLELCTVDVRATQQRQARRTA